MSIKASGVPETRPSEEHPYLVIKKEDARTCRGSANGQKLRHQPQEDGTCKRCGKTIEWEPQWVPAEELKPGDYLLSPLDRPVQMGSSVGIPRARMLGYYLGDGHIISQRCGRKKDGPKKDMGFGITVGSDSPAHLDRLLECLSEADLRNEPRMYELDGRNASVVNVYDQAAAAWLQHQGGRGSRGKYLSMEVFDWPEEEKLSLLGGYIDTDGCWDKNGTVRMVTISRGLALDIQRLCHMTGILATVHKSPSRGGFSGETDTYVVLIPASNSEVLAPYSVKSEGRIREAYTSTQSFFWGGYWCTPIRSVELSDDEEEVYNITVANDESYVAEGVAVHNCLLCGHKSRTRADYCSCMKNMRPTSILDDGRVVGVDNLHPRFFDISFVFIGADKTAKVMIKLGSGLYVPSSVIDAEILYGMSSDEEGLIKAASEGCGHKCGRCDNRGSCGKFEKIAEAGRASRIARSAGAQIAKAVDKTPPWADDLVALVSRQAARSKPDKDKTASGDMIEYHTNKHNIEVGPPPKPNRKEFPFTGTINYRGIKIHVENLRGSTREGTGPGGKKWSTKMLHHYGEIVGTRGVDKDKLDVYVGPEPSAKEVYIVHQNHPGNHPKAGKYDEDKVMLGFASADAARQAYLDHYDRKDFFRSMTVMPFAQFKKSIYGEVKGEKVASDKELEGLFKVANGGDDDEGRAPTKEEEQQIRDFIANTPNLSDKKFHAFLEAKGINPHKGEEVVYKVLHQEMKKEALSRRDIAILGAGGAGLGALGGALTSDPGQRGTGALRGAAAGAVGAPVVFHLGSKLWTPIQEMRGRRILNKADAYNKKRRYDKMVAAVNKREYVDPDKFNELYQEMRRIPGGHGAALRPGQAAYELGNKRVSDLVDTLTLTPLPAAAASAGAGALLGKKDPEKTASAELEKIAIDMKLEDLFNNAKTAQRRMRAWKNSDGEMTIHTGSGLGTRYETMEKTASWKLDPSKPELPDPGHPSMFKWQKGGNLERSPSGLGYSISGYKATYAPEPEGMGYKEVAKFMKERRLAGVSTEEMERELKEKHGLAIGWGENGPVLIKVGGGFNKKNLTSLERSALSSYARHLGEKPRDMDEMDAIESIPHWEEKHGKPWPQRSSFGGLVKSASLEALKMAALKLADQNKRAEIDKQINPEGTVGLVSEILRNGERRLPSEVLEEMSRGSLESALTTPSAMGMVLHPGEFQRMLLTKVNRPDLADHFDRHHVRFAPVDEEIPPCEALGRDHFSHPLMRLLAPLMGHRSYLGPRVRMRIIRIRVVPKPREEILESSPLLDKISGAYNWYRREMMKTAADIEDLMAESPELKAAVYGLEDEDLMKVALSEKQVAVVVGSVPLSLMYSASLRGKERQGAKLGVVEKLVADHPWATSLGVAAGLRELMKNPSAVEATGEKVKSLLR